MKYKVTREWVLMGSVWKEYIVEANSKQEAMDIAQDLDILLPLPGEDDCYLDWETGDEIERDVEDVEEVEDDD